MDPEFEKTIVVNSYLLENSKEILNSSKFGKKFTNLKVFYDFMDCIEFSRTFQKNKKLILENGKNTENFLEKQLLKIIVF